MPINNVGFNPNNGTVNGIRPMQSNGFRGPSALMPELGANQIVERKLLETVAFLTEAGPRATRLGTAIANLPAAFNPRVAVSGNTNLLQVASFNGQNIPNTTFLIHQTATTQRNEGANLAREALAEAEGLHEFEIEVDGRAYKFSFTVEGEVTNQQLQQLMATAINNANLGITATVAVSGDYSTLRLETGTTGPGADGQPRFTIRDITGEAVALTGVEDITQEAQNAIFSVNGGEKQTSATNRVDLGNGLIVNLIKASEEEVTVHKGRDRLSMINGVQDVVNRFNALLEAATVNGTDRNTRMLIRDLQNAARFSRRELERIGINIGRDGFLSINESAINAAIENGRLEQFFTGTGSRQGQAFINRLSRIADSVARNPMRHVSPHASRLPGFHAAMNAVNSANNSGGSGSQGAAQQSSPFDAYLPDDWRNILFDAFR